MLVPAIAKKDEIQSLMAEKYYSTDMFYYVGDLGSFPINIAENCEKGLYQYASVDEVEDGVIGYIAYTIDFYSQQAYNFGLISFDKGNLILARDLDAVLKNILNNPAIHRLEWKVIGGNPIEPTYDRFCQKHKGKKYTLHNVCRDWYGTFHNESIYEVLW